ncbi:hypothetical protein QFZ82_007600 [Streptomyces sp. V4I23]|uniref:hypothetical protein n=1 Tax=Streptomyces sp. V4I23 TaxID=3042282 RepID=UPI00277E24E9|nr:hypothetical protein [Streptomyces sp. V4I23]MDQ1013115.1 hypothetical protein [Streptomyces sp. V4I23]
MTGDQETEDLLDEQVKLIGGFMEEDEQPAGEQGVVTLPEAGARRRRVRALLVAGVGLAASAALFLTLWAPWDPAPAETARLSESGIVACSELIAEGTVSRVRSAEPGTVRVRLEVDRYLKPESGPGETDFSVPQKDGAAYKVGEKVLVSVSRFEDEVPLLFIGEEIEPTWEWMRTEAGKADRPTCPGRG